MTSDLKLDKHTRKYRHGNSRNVSKPDASPDISDNRPSSSDYEKRDPGPFVDSFRIFQPPPLPKHSRSIKEKGVAFEILEKISPKRQNTDFLPLRGASKFYRIEIF